MLTKVRRLPSPALVISGIALILAIGGTAAALAPTDSAKDKTIAKKVANKLITKRAKSLSVSHAVTANTATNATHAATADSASSLVAPEAVHEVGAPGEPPFENGDANYGLGYADVGFYIDRQCVVHLVGTADVGSSPTPSTVFTLPPAYRPAATVMESVGAKAGTSPNPAYLIVTNAGEVQVASVATGELLMGLDGASFRAASC